jgi:hypothetical protein
MDNDDIHVDTVSLSTHCPGMDKRMTSIRTRGNSMQQDIRFTTNNCITNLNREIMKKTETRDKDTVQYSVI